MVIGWNCERWQCLPDDGGYRDQDAFLMLRMNASLNIYNTVMKLRNSTGDKIHNLTTGERRVAKMLLDKGLL